MKIRPKYIPKYENGNPLGIGYNIGDDSYNDSWRTQIFDKYRQDIINRLNTLKSREYEDNGEALKKYVDWLNGMLTSHYKLYKAARGENRDNNFIDNAYVGTENSVGNYQEKYQGSGNGSISNYNFNVGIKNAYDSGRYDFYSNANRIKIDRPRTNGTFGIDNYYSAITNDRRILGRISNDFRDSDIDDWVDKEKLKEFNDAIRESGYELKLDDATQYYMLRPILNTAIGPIDPTDPAIEEAITLLPVSRNPQDPAKTLIEGAHTEGSNFWTNFNNTLSKYKPELLGIGRLVGGLANNARVYDAALKAIRPNLQLSFHTHRQVVGDEATKQAFYRRGILGITRASRPLTSDADRQIATLMESYRQANELKEKGDLADNLEIKRTSELSNEHLDKNLERDTQVANTNTIELNKANAAKWNLRALNYTADLTSIDNFLKGIETDWRLDRSERKAIALQLFTLNWQERFQNDKKLLNIKSQRDRILKENNYDYSDLRVLDLERQYRELTRKLQRLMLRARLENMDYLGGIDFVKSGTKITYKRKDDLLYKSTRDAVEHFRKMTKMLDESTRKSRSKAVKLVSPPKSRKLQLGGVAPFFIYTPAVSGGERSTATTIGTESNSGSREKDKKDTSLDLIKELMKHVGDGILPSDAEYIYRQLGTIIHDAEVYGENFDSSDIATRYVSIMHQLNNAKYSKSNFDKAKTLATTKGALNEYAVTTTGQYVVLDSNGKIKYATLEEITNSEGKLNPLTNNQLLDIRAYYPELAFRKGDELMQIVNNGIGIDEIGKYIKSVAISMGDSEFKLEGMSPNEREALRKGAEILLGATTDITNKNQTALANAALKYLIGILPRNMKAILEIEALNSGVSSSELLKSYINGQLSSLHSEEVDEKSLKSSGTKGTDIEEKIKGNPLLWLVQEKGGTPRRYSILTRDSNTRLSVNGTNYSSLPKVTNDMSVDKMLNTSKIDSIVDSKYGITFGDLQINPENLKDIMYANSGNNMIVTLPCKIVDGHKQINLAVKDLYEKAELEALQKVPNRHSEEFEKVLGEKLKLYHLDSLLDSKGLPNRKMFALFLVVEAYTTDRINFDTNSQYVEKVQDPDSNLEKRISTALSTDNKKSDYKIDIDDKWGFLELTYDNVYRANLFIPLNSNPMAAMYGLGQNISIEESRRLEELNLEELSGKKDRFIEDNSR